MKHGKPNIEFIKIYLNLLLHYLYKISITYLFTYIYTENLYGKKNKQMEILNRDSYGVYKFVI